MPVPAFSYARAAPSISGRHFSQLVFILGGRGVGVAESLTLNLSLVFTQLQDMMYPVPPIEDRCTYIGWLINLHCLAYA